MRLISWNIRAGGGVRADRIADQLMNWSDAFRVLHHNKREFTWYSPNGKNGFRLDQMFVHPALKNQITSFTHCWGGQTEERRDHLSDHAALIMDIRV